MSVAFSNLLEPGEMGDTELNLRLTGREVAALVFLATVASSDFDAITHAAQAAHRNGLGVAFCIAYQSAMARLGIAIADTYEPSGALHFVGELARIDQEQSALHDDERNA